MSRERFPFLFCFFAAFISLFHPFPKAFAARLELNAYLAEVRRDNPVLRAASLRRKSAESRVKPAGSWDDPFFAAGPDQLPFSGQNMSVIRYQANQTIPFPGRLKARSNVAGAVAEMGAADAETLARQTVIMATYYFYKGYFLQESLRNNLSQRAFVHDTAQSEESRYQAGESVHHEWLLATAELGVLETEALRLKREKAVVDATLNQYRNKPIEMQVGTLVLRLGSGTVNQEIGSDALIDQPEYKAYQAQLKAFENQRKLAKLSWVPEFMVQAMVMQSLDEMREPSNWGAMMGVSLPLFGYRKQAKLIDAAEYDVKAAQADLEQITNKLATARKAVRLEVDTARSVANLYRSSVIPRTELAYQSARTAYENKRLPLSGLMQVARVRQAQKLEFLAAQLDIQLAKVKGRELLSEPPLLRLAPEVPTLFGAGGMTAPGMTVGDMGTSAAGMGTRGMTGPAAKPQNVSDQNDAGMGGGGM